MSVTPEAVPDRECVPDSTGPKTTTSCASSTPMVEVIDRFSVAPHRAPDCNDSSAALLRAGVTEIGIERGDGPVIDALLATDLVVLVISPNQVKNLRSRYGSAGNKDDRFDAYVLADVVRTDRRSPHTPAPFEPPQPGPCAPPCAPDVISSSTASRPPTSSAHTCRSCSQAWWACSASSTRRSALSFIERFTTQAKVDWLSPTRMSEWLKKLSYSGHTDPAVLHPATDHSPPSGPAPTPRPVQP